MLCEGLELLSSALVWSEGWGGVSSWELGWINPLLALQGQENFGQVD